MHHLRAFKIELLNGSKHDEFRGQEKIKLVFGNVAAEILLERVKT